MYNLFGRILIKMFAAKVFLSINTTTATAGPPLLAGLCHGLSAQLFGVCYQFVAGKVSFAKNVWLIMTIKNC
jgi:hypothetical protein